MIDPKSAWLFTRTFFWILLLLLETAIVVSALYFGLYTTSYIKPFFQDTNNDAGAFEAKVVYICCFVIIAFMLLLLGAQVTRVVLALVAGQDAPPPPPQHQRAGVPRRRSPRAPWARGALAAATALLLGACLFGTLYPLLVAPRWRPAFAAAGRPDLARGAAALAAAMAFALAVGLAALLWLYWACGCWMCGGAGAAAEEDA